MVVYFIRTMVSCINMIFMLDFCHYVLFLIAFLVFEYYELFCIVFIFIFLPS